MPPTISGVSGSTVHGETLVINGSGFGSKPTAAPLAWDDASGPDDVRDVWSDGWPNHNTNTGDRNVRRRNIHRGVNPPHGRTNRYISGLHNLAGESFNAFKGPNVFVHKAFSWPASTPVEVYQSCWWRTDPSWAFSGSSDNNFKCFRFHRGLTSETANPITGLGFVSEYNPRPTSLGASPGWHTYSGSDSYPSIWGSSSVNPMTQWVKTEIVYRIEESSNGFHRIIDNGNQRLAFSGSQTEPAGPLISFVFGGFAREYHNANNWRYFTDCYLDVGFSRVILGNADTLQASTIREVQVPTSWATGEVSVTVNRGVFSDEDGPYLYVVDANNEPNAVGFELSGETPDPPSPPPPIVRKVSRGLGRTLIRRY